MANRREDTGQFAIRGGISGAPGEKWNAKVRETFLGEIDDSEEKDSFKQYFSVLLDDLFAGEEAKVVYRVRAGPRTKQGVEAGDQADTRVAAPVAGLR